MARRDPLLPNAAIIARREYRDRVRGPLFVASTVVLMLLAHARRAVADRGSATSTARPSTQDRRRLERRGARGRGPSPSRTACSTSRPSGVAIRRPGRGPYAIEIATDAEAPSAISRPGGSAGSCSSSACRRTSSTSCSGRPAPPTASAASSSGSRRSRIGILDWTAELPGRFAARARSRRRPTGSTRSTRRPTVASGSIAQQTASRAFLGAVFVVLLFLSVMIYGMWVATGVAAEKSSRVMELMISAASTAPDAGRQGRRDRRWPA